MNEAKTKTIKFLERAEVEAIISSIKQTGMRNLRDRALFEVLWSTGLRIAECIALPDAPFIKNREQTLEMSITGKGGYTRTIYFSPQALKAIKYYLTERKDSGTELFLITIRRAQQIIKDRSLSAGFEGIHPHSLRHSFGTYILSKTGNIRLCQEMLGHRSITSTMLYTHITSRELKLEHNKLFK